MGLLGILRPAASFAVLRLVMVLATVMALAALAPARAEPVETVTPDIGLAPYYGSDQQASVAPATSPLFTPAAPVPLFSNDDHGRALDCMSWAIAYEAAGQPIVGQEAVGQVILNRVRNPHRPKTVCGVVFEGSERRTGCQFTFACDGSLHRRLSPETLMTARNVAKAVLDGAVPDHVGGATHYHADYVLPVWAATGRRVTQIGAHIFYAMPGDSAIAPMPIATVGEPAMIADIPAPLPRRVARPGRRARFVRQPAPVAPQGAGHSMFQPWGLPVAGQE